MSSERIARRFDLLKEAGRAGLITYVMAYDPDYETSLEILKGLPQAGADFIELGIPFSDPAADGPAIQEAAKRALANKATMQGIFDMVKTFRKDDGDTPVILMGYYNMVYHYGEEAFAADAAIAGVDGFILVDLPPEEDAAFFNATQVHALSLIKLVTPTTDESRLQEILPKASGFLYYVSVAGVTGTRSAEQDSIASSVAFFKQHTDIPVVVGFGVKTPEQAKAIGEVADGVVVGSELVRQIETHLGNKPLAKEALLDKVKALSLR